MNALDIDLIRKSARENAPGTRSTAHSLDRMTSLQLARRTVIFTVDAAGIASLMDRAREDIPGLTTCEIFQAATNHNPDIFWAIARKDRFDISEPRGEGFLAVLPLTHEGMRRLIDGRLDTRNPELCYVARQSERPAESTSGRSTPRARWPRQFRWCCRRSRRRLSRRQHLLGADHQGRNSGFWSRWDSSRARVTRNCLRPACRCSTARTNCRRSSRRVKIPYPSGS